MFPYVAYSNMGSYTSGRQLAHALHLLEPTRARTVRNGNP